MLYNSDELLNVILFLGIVLICSSIFSVENKYGMVNMIRSSFEGRKKIFGEKMKVAVILTMFLFVIVTVFEISSVYKVYGISGLATPVQSISHLNFVTIDCNIGVFLTGLYMIKGLVMLAIAFLTCMISMKISQKITIGVACSLCVPELLVLSGIPYFQYVSIIRILSIAPFMMAVKNVGVVFCVVAIFATAGVFSYIVGYKRWCNT